MVGPLAGFDWLPFEATDLDLTSLHASLQFRARDMQEISPLPDAGSELAIAPAEPLAPARPSGGSGKWTAAIIISCVLHAAVAAAFLISPAGRSDFQNTTQSEGSDQTGDKVAGSALDKEPAAVNVSLVPNPQPPKPQPVKAAKPVQPTKPSQPVNQAPEPTREAAKQLPKPLPDPVKQPSVAPDILVATPRPDDQSVAAKAETAQPNAQAEAIEMPVAVPDQPPIPSARPTPAPSKAADEKRGTADGQDLQAQAASKGKKQKEAGSDAEDSYRGDVIRKLSRVNRAVPPALQLTARNNAVVTFVISSKGGIDDLRILESSGSPTFDQIVLGIVRKAAPFPPIPSKIGSSLEFTGAIGPF